VIAEAMREVENHGGNVWTHVISLRREDAERLCYNTPETWRKLVARHVSDLAKWHKIDLHNIKWYGAFHNTGYHPHMHLVVFSQNTKQSFLTNTGIENLRSVFANDIF
jgi:hypothetical protein